MNMAPLTAAQQETHAMSIVASEIMGKPAVTARPDQTVAEVAAILLAHGIGAMPVCDKDGALVGIVSELDIIRPFGDSALKRGEGWLLRLAEGEMISKDFLDFVHRDKRTVGDVMARKVLTAGPDTTLPQLAELVSQNSLKHVPIVSHGKVLGVVSRGDILAAIARGPSAFE